MRGLKRIRQPWMHPLYRKKRQVTSTAPTEQEKARSQALKEEWLKKLSETPAHRAAEKIADREARVAVEGDTDINHDNIEAAE